MTQKKSTHSKKKVTKSEVKTSKKPTKKEIKSQNEFEFFTKRNIIAGVIILALAVIFLLLVCTDNAKQLKNSLINETDNETSSQQVVVAYINSTPIYSDRLNLIESQLDLTGQEVNKTQIVDILVNQQLLYEFALNKGFNVSNEFVEEQLVELSNRQGKTKEEYLLEINETLGYDEDFMLGELKRQIVISQLRSSLLDSINVSEEEAKEFYDNNGQEFVQNSQEIPFEEVKDTIIEYLENQYAEEYLMSVISDARESSKIKILI